MVTSTLLLSASGQSIGVVSFVVSGDPENCMHKTDKEKGSVKRQILFHGIYPAVAADPMLGCSLSESIWMNRPMMQEGFFPE